MGEANRSPTGWVVWLRAGVALLVVIAVLATFLPLIDTNTWWIRFLSFPRVQVFCALLVLLLVSLALPDRFRWTGLATSLVALAAIAFDAWVLAPYTPLAPVQALAAQNCEAPNRISLLEANIQMTNEHDDRLFRTIAATDPDVLLFEEVDEWWDRQFETLHDRYPYNKHYVTQNYYGITLISKYPLTSAEIRFLADSRDPSIFATLRLPSGADVNFYGIHPRPPTFGQSSAERDAQILATALIMGQSGQPGILSGDLNATPWSPIVRRAARVSQALDPRIGRGWKPTWKADAWLRRWPLDQVLLTPHFTVQDLQVLPPFGSDHQPVLSRLCFNAAPVGARNAPHPDPADLAAARAAIAKGQNKAAPSPEPSAGKQSPQ